MYRIIDRLPPTCVTLLGSTQGPAIATGTIQRNWKQPVFIGRTEWGEIVRVGREAGWGEEQTAKLLADIDERDARIASLEERLSRMRDLAVEMAGATV